MSTPRILKYGGRAKPHDVGVIITRIEAIRQWPDWLINKKDEMNNQHSGLAFLAKQITMSSPPQNLCEKI
jgi:hypothetical protein